LPSSDRPRILVVVIVQFLLGILDLVGVALIGIVGALSISGIKSNLPGNRTQNVLNFLRLDNFSFQSQVAILGLLAAFFLLGRTVVSVILSRKILHFLSRRGAMISASLVSKLMTQPLMGIRQTSSQETLFALTSGVQSITLGVLATAITLVSDFSLLILLGIGLFIVNSWTAIAAILFFGIVSLIVYKTSSGRAQKLGFENTTMGIETSETILEVLGVYREVFVRDRREYYVRRISAIRYRLASVLAEIQFLPNISKYVMESSMVVGALLLAAIQFMLTDANRAFATLTIFLAAGTRIAPAVMRIQQGLIQLRSSIGTSRPTLELSQKLNSISDADPVSDEINTNHKDFRGELALKHVQYSYPHSNDLALKNVNLKIFDGSSVAIVGPSGAGKTTLVDVLLGVLEIETGEVNISNMRPSDAIKKWPGAIAYVPQDTVLVNASIRENIAIGFPADSANDQMCWEALELAQLSDYVRALPNGLDSMVHESGSNLSGGQRQRLGIARALLTKPKVLVLDEATSSLDARTELDISSAIQSLKGRVTVITIAHRLSTVQHADKVVYLEGGEVKAEGSFSEVRSLIPDFDSQARLMGL
jgi:ABC-type multidrug transport system fused ATPase/permease subunit